MAKSPASAAAAPTDTPAMAQYKRFKAENPGTVLFFRLGDFFELFFDDAVLANKVLGVTLTQRQEGVPMAGVPYHAVENYLRRMVAAGHKVAIADQVETAAEAKGAIRREVTRIVTPGTLTDDALLDEGRENPLLAVSFSGAGMTQTAALAFAELSTGRFQTSEVPARDLADELARISPSEILFADDDSGAPPAALAEAARGLSCALTARPGWQFRPADATEVLKRQYAVKDLGGLGLEAQVIPPAGAVVAYLLETQRTSTDGRLAHLQVPAPFLRGEFLVLDQASLRSLEVVETLRGAQVAGSLLGIFNGPCAPATAMGKRLLRRWLCYPLAKRAPIEARQAGVEALVSDENLRLALRKQLGGVQDIERILARLSVGRISPRDLVALGASGAQAAPLAQSLAAHPLLAHAAATVTPRLQDLCAFAARISTACVEAPPPHLRDGGLIKDGFDADLDESRLLQRDSHAWLAQYQARLMEETGLPKLKVGFNSVFGYYIELSAGQKDKAPAQWTRKQTLTNAERFITPELKVFEGKVLSAESRGKAREQVLFAALCDEARAAAPALGAFATACAQLDCLVAFAQLAVKRAFVKPELKDEPALDIAEGRHPVLDELLGDRFTPNDTTLGGGHATLALITGPNMAGKSTYIRQTALIALLAHTGCFVPAKRAVIGLCDRIFTRVGSSDELHAGRSTFMVEMSETAHICHHATSRSLIVLDEIGRGTSTLDGLSLAWAIAEHVAQVGARCLFATHYHEITRLADDKPGVKNLSVSVREWKDDIVFLHRIVEGATDRSYGIHVAKIAGLPPSVVARANDLLAQLAVKHEGEAAAQAPATPAKKGKKADPAPFLPLFSAPAEPHPVVEELRQADLNSLTPMMAFDLVRKWRAQAEK